VQKHDWSEERRRSIRTSVPYLSALDYLRILNGWEDDVLDEEAAEQWDRERDVSEVDLPFIQLSTTYRFGHTTAALAHDTVYEQDEITFTADGASNPLPARSDVGDGFRSVLTADSPITLITYNAAQTYQQSNEIEEAIAAALIDARPSGINSGVVTPHNAQKSRLQATIYDSSTSGTPRENVQIETVNRFQGGEADLMVLSGTVADSQYIRAEADFLLTETRVNVAMTRHKRTLVVIAPQSLLGYIPADPELYDHATIWKTIAAWAGEDPTNASVAAWEGDLQSLLVDTSHLDTLPDVEYETKVSIYQIPPVENRQV
jgi:uncharacterized protein